MLTIALSKGRIFDETLPLLAAAGIEPLENPESSRKLVIGTNLPGEVWTNPINKDPADRPPALSS